VSVETVLITGASAGIGRELAACFAADRSRLVLVARRKRELESLAEELRERYKTQSEVIVGDLSQPTTPTRLFEHLRNNGSKVDVLVNNAGFGAYGQFAELDERRQLDMAQVNIVALTHLTRLFLPGMLARKRGGVLNVASTASFQGGPGMAVYYASKAYVLSFSEAISEETAGTGVVVTALCPGATATEFPQASGMKNSKLFERASMSAAVVARIGHRAFRKGRFVVVAGLPNKLMSFSTRLVPRAAARKVAAYLNNSKHG